MVVPSQQIAPRPIILRPGTKSYDLLFGIPLIAWCGFTFYFQSAPFLRAFRMVLSDHRDFVALMNVFGKAAALAFTVTVIVLVVIRRPASSSAPGIVSKAVAFLGAYLSVIIVGLPIQQISTPLMVVSTILIFAGSGFSLYALIWLGRSISVTSEARHLVTGGPYSLVRHPLYLGEEIALIGLAMRHWLLLSFVILVVQMGFQLYRMGFEEQVMRQAFPEYADYARRTKRLVPWIY